MAGNKIVGITIDIEGKTSGLTKSLQEANSAISKTAAALKDVDKALELDPKNVDLIAQKEALLNKQIEQTNEKLEIMQQVANDANDALERGDISQEQYASLTAEIAKTDAALAELEGEANGAGDEVEELGDEAEESSSNMNLLKDAAIAVGAAMVAAFSEALAIAKEVGEALVSATTETASFADEMLTLSSTTGLSAQTLQELTYASELLDVDVSTITGSMTKMEKSMASSADKYAELGVAVTNADGSFRSAEEVFWDTIDALGEIEDPVQRDLMAMELMGKSAKELNPLIEAGSDAFKELAEEANETGYVMSDETLDAFGAFDDQMVRFQNSTDNMQHALGGILLPLLGDLAGDGTDLLNEFAKAIAGSGGDMKKIGDAISKLLPKLLETLKKQIPKILDMILGMVNTIIDILLDNLDEILDAAMQIIDTIVKTLLTPENLAKLVDATLKIVMTIAEYVIQNLPLIIEAAVQIIVALMEGLTEAIPDLIPIIIDAVVMIVNTLLDNLPLLLKATLDLIVAVAKAIVENIPEIIKVLPEIITGIVEFLLSPEGIGEIISAGVELFTGLVGNIPDIIAALVEGLGQMLVGMVDYITGDMFDDITEAFGSIFGQVIEDALSWGADIIKNLVDGIKSMWDYLVTGVGGVADFIADNLGFSVPKEGPLHAWAYNNPGADMIKLWTDGMESEMPYLESALTDAANTINGSMFDVSTGAEFQNTSNIMASSPVDYSDILGRINGSISALGGESQIVVPVYIGQERIETIIAQANNNLSFISGGR